MSSGKNYDICITAEQVEALGWWAEPGAEMAPVYLYLDENTSEPAPLLIAWQGDEKIAWDYNGEKCSDEYIALAPLD